ncbi:MAG: hypothetical protein DRO12_02460 [Thermoprotei archaeon]|nr:MAG: hypothetical protein DRO12_02460 [Thermoprotei archaeon]
MLDVIKWLKKLKEAITQMSDLIYAHKGRHKPGGADALFPADFNIEPASDNTYDLGTSSYRWRNLELAGYGNLGSLRIGGTEVITSGRVLQNVTSIAQSLLPDTDNTRDLGSDSYEWRHAYIRGILYGNSYYTYDQAGNRVQFLIRAVAAPNTHFHIFPNYTKPADATDITVWFGYNSEILKYEFKSKWTGSNVSLLSLRGDELVNYSRSFLPFSDNAYDIGSSSYAWRRIFGYVHRFVPTSPPASPFEGDVIYDTADKALKVFNGTDWLPVGRVVVPLVFDDTQKSVSGTTETEVKHFRFSKTSSYTNWKKLTVVASLWVDGGTGTLKIYINDETSPRLSLSTTNTSESVVSGEIDISDLGEGVHTLRVKLVNDGSYNTYTELLEVYAQ